MSALVKSASRRSASRRSALRSLLETNLARNPLTLRKILPLKSVRKKLVSRKRPSDMSTFERSSPSIEQRCQFTCGIGGSLQTANATPTSSKNIPTTTHAIVVGNL